MAKLSAKQRAESYIKKQERRVEALDLINQIAALENKVAEPKKEEVKSEKKKRKKKKGKKVQGGEKSGENDEEDEEEEEENEEQRKEVEGKDEDSQVKLTFVDNRGSIKGFANIPKVTKKKRSYTWKEKLAEEERKRRKLEEEDYFNSTDDGSEGELSEDDNPSEQEEAEAETEEFKGFSDEDQQENHESSEDDQSSEVDESSEDDSDDSLAERQKLAHLNEKASSFMNWIDEHTEKSAPTPVLNIDYKPLERAEDKELLSDEEEVKIYDDDENSKPAFYVSVERDPEIQAVREELPVFKKEQDIMEAIRHNDVVIICGETGSGKTTQVPQFLYEAGFGHPDSETKGMIGITQPRRVAAMSMAARVSTELCGHGHVVSHQIRFDSTVKKDTRMKFMTDGVLLREMMSDFLLLKYSAIILDEAHERNVNTDILIGMLSRVVRLRSVRNAKDGSIPKLKLIIMSATLRVSDFAENSRLFATPPPILKVEARMYPVSVHFSKKTPYNYVDEAFRKACKIHQRLPRGGILIFLTSQQEIMDLVRRLRERFPLPRKQREHAVEVKMSSKEADVEDEEVDFSVKVQNKEDFEELEDEDFENEEGFEEELEDGQTDSDPLYVLPLYSLLPNLEQMKVFKQPPGNARLCVVATNIAETSITIPGVRYVVDSGRAKQKVLGQNAVQSYEVMWVSQASAEQRAGRAGRTGPGHTYRLYSSAIFDGFEQFSVPEILRMPIESVVLQMKSIGIDNIENFPFPTPVDRSSLARAEKLLLYLGALDKDRSITDLGRSMSAFPLSPRFARMLLTGDKEECLPYVIAIVCALSVGSPFLLEVDLGVDFNLLNNDEEEEDDGEHNRKMAQKERMGAILERYRKALARFSALSDTSDALRVLCAVAAVDFYKTPEKRTKFMRENFLRPKIVEEIAKLRRQLLHIVKTQTAPDGVAAESREKELLLKRPPSKKQVYVLQQIIATGFLDQVAVRADVVGDIKISRGTSVGGVPYKLLFTTEDGDGYVYIHVSLVLHNRTQKPPEYLVYETLDLNDDRTRVRMRPLTDIDGRLLANVAKGTPLLAYSKPLGPPYAPEVLSASKQRCYVVPRFGGQGSAVSWDLPVVRVIQEKIGGVWHTV